MSTATVSLLVPIRNEERYIEACLEALRAQTYAAEQLEILVIDGDSTDATRSIVERQISLDPRIRLLDNPERNMSAGLNIGISDAKADLLGVVSGHSVLPSDYVARCVEALEQTDAWAVGGRIVRTAHTPIQRAIAVATSSPIGVGDSRHNYATEPGWVEAVFPGFWRRELFDRVGPFDPDMVANEDNELSYRIRKAGGRIFYDPAIAVEYSPRGSFTGLFDQYRRYGLGKIRVLRKHRGGLRWRHFVPAAWVAFLIGGGLVALFVPSFAVVWLAGMGLYLAVMVAASVRLREPGTPWWMILAAFITLHFAYGIGTWQGLLTWGRR